MNANTIANGIVRAILFLAGLVLLGYFLYAIRSVLAYLAIAGVIALLGKPLVSFLNNRLRFPSTLSVMLTLLFFFGIFAGLLALFVPVIVEQGKNLSLLDIEQLKSDINVLYSQILEYFNANFGGVEEVVDQTKVFDQLLQELNLSFIPNFLNSFINILSSLSVGLFSVLFISFFFLKDSNLLQNGILTFVPQKREAGTVASIDKINKLLSRYFGGILLQLTILFFIYTAVLLIVGVENAIVIAFISALFNIIPYVGPIIGGVIMITLTMTSFLGYDFSSVILPKALYVLIGLFIGQLVDNFFSQPFIFSNSVRSHPLEIFLIIIIAGLLFGIIGLVIAVPGYTAIKVILKEFLAENEVIKKFTRDV